MRTALLASLFIFGGINVFYGKAEADIVALVGDAHVTNILKAGIDSAMVSLGVLAGYFHINTPEWFKPKEGGK